MIHPAGTGTIIETAPLRLRAHPDADLDELVRFVGSWTVAVWMSGVPHPYTDAHGRDFIGHVRQMQAVGSPRSFAIAAKDSDRLMAFTESLAGLWS